MNTSYFKHPDKYYDEINKHKLNEERSNKIRYYMSVLWYQ